MFGNFALGRGFVVFLVFCFLFMAPGTALCGEKSAYKIGVNLELTGPWANVTKTLKMAMEMEVERVNRMGGIDGHPLELVIKDNGFDMAKLSTNMLEFVRNKEILAVVGPFEDNFQATTRAIAEREGITNIIVCPSNPTVRQKQQRWAFNIAHNDMVVSEKLVDLCLARGYQRVLVFAGNWPLAQSLAQNFKGMGRDKGINVTLSKETHKPTDIDMTPQLIKIKPVLKQKGIQALYAATGGPPGPVICKNMRTLGMKVPVLGTHAFGFGFIIALGGKAMEGVEFPTGKPVVPYQLDANDPVRRTVIGLHERMKSRYGVGADQISGHAYDIVWLLHDALKRCGGKMTRRALRDALEKTRGFKGCTGVFNYSPADHDGLGKTDMVFVRIQGGRFVRLKF
jgi:branched-chain amino acid transport system substrate-binding protein